MKTKEQDELEPSCTFHLFPNNEIMIQNAMRVLNAGTLVWHPSNSVTPRPKEKFRKEFTLHNPTPTFSLRTPDITEKITSKPQPRSQSEARIDFPNIRPESRLGMFVHDINMSKQAKLDRNKKTSVSTETRTPLIPKGNVMKNLKHKYAGYLRSKKLHKSQSAPNFLELPKPSPPQNERKHLSVKPYPSEFTNFPDNMKVMPVYTLWSTDDNKSNITPESSSRQSLKPEMDEGSLQKVAEYILNEQHSSSPVDVRFRQEIAVADGVDLMFHTLIYPQHDLIDVLHKYDS
jgi:hypothetical protein